MIDYDLMEREFEDIVEREKIRVSKEFLEKGASDEDYNVDNFFIEIRALNRAKTLFSELVSRRTSK